MDRKSAYRTIDSIGKNNKLCTKKKVVENFYFNQTKSFSNVDFNHHEQADVVNR